MSSGVVAMRSFEFLVAMCVGALVLVLAAASFKIVFAKLGLVFGAFVVVFLVFELAYVAFLAFVVEVVPTDAVALQFEELVHFAFAADFQLWVGGYHGEDGVDGSLQLSRHHLICV